MSIFSADDPADQWKFRWMWRVYFLVGAAVLVMGAGYAWMVYRFGVRLVGEELNPINRRVLVVGGFLAALAGVSVLLGVVMAWTWATFGVGRLEGPRFGGPRSLARLLSPPLVALSIFTVVVAVEGSEVWRHYEQSRGEVQADEAMSAGWMKLADEPRADAMRAWFWPTWSMDGYDKGVLLAFLDRHATAWATTLDIADVVQRFYADVDAGEGERFMAEWLRAHPDVTPPAER